MKVTSFIFRTSFFLPSASRFFTLSRRAPVSAPSTRRPSSATTVTPLTSRFAILRSMCIFSFGRMGHTLMHSRYGPVWYSKNDKRQVIGRGAAAPCRHAVNDFLLHFLERQRCSVAHD